MTGSVLQPVKPEPSPKFQFHSVAPAALTWNCTVALVKESLVGAKLSGSDGREPRVKLAWALAGELVALLTVTLPT